MLNGSGYIRTRSFVSRFAEGYAFRDLYAEILASHSPKKEGRRKTFKLHSLWSISLLKLLYLLSVPPPSWWEWGRKEKNAEQLFKLLKNGKEALNLKMVENVLNVEISCIHRPWGVRRRKRRMKSERSTTQQLVIIRKTQQSRRLSMNVQCWIQNENVFRFSRESSENFCFVNFLVLCLDAIGLISIRIKATLQFFGKASNYH